MQIGIGKNDASYLLSVIGISNIIGKICLGFISDHSWVNRLYLYSGCLGICGLSKLNEKSFSFLYVTVLIFQVLLQVTSFMTTLVKLHIAYYLVPPLGATLA